MKSGKKSVSDILREDWQVVETGHQCAYCGSTEELEKEHIVPRSLKIPPECAHCDKIQSINNQVWACKSCNRSKKTIFNHIRKEGKITAKMAQELWGVSRRTATTRLKEMRDQGLLVELSTAPRDPYKLLFYLNIAINREKHRS